MPGAGRAGTSGWADVTKTGFKSRARVWAVCAVIAGLGTSALVSQAGPALAQSGWWPWATPEQPSRPPPRDPGWRAQPQAQPPGYPPPSAQTGPGIGGGQKAPICFQLEQRLVQESQRGTLTREQLPRIEADLRQADRNVQAGQAQLERANCYDYFLFSKTLRRTRQCVDLSAQVDEARRKVAELDSQRQQILGSRDRSYQDDIYRELARNNCGADYAREAQRRGGSNPFSSLWQDEDTDSSAGRGTEFGSLPFATYRTVCVRLCDGYYFPISFSTLPNHFQRDVEACQSKCAAPAELYYHQNPGGAMEQAVSAMGQQPYTGLKTAFRYRKEYVQGCSCKQAEYTPSPADRGERKAEAPPNSTPIRQVQR